ncbi:hypothetical protein H2203_002080 [Taxawa tesnikishii (nom. ined.)]|nr:hypothetical protein H2203_002080 [Dothideales sp. JES 119]
MANPPELNVSGLPNASPEESAATSSPARGREMRTNLLSKLRSPPLVHAWEFWHDRQDRSGSKGDRGSSDNQQPDPMDLPMGQQDNDTHLPEPSRLSEAGKYEDRLKHLASITDVRSFWSTFNNFDTSAMPLRDSIHLFHRGVKPVWEDPRNARGGSWTFRVPKDRAAEFWKEINMMAIGEQLQAAVSQDSSRTSFRDDICGISLSVRFTSILVQVWNRDGDHEHGIRRILDTVLDNLPEQLRPKDTQYYYKKHSEHAGFSTVAAKGAGGSGGSFKFNSPEQKQQDRRQHEDPKLNAGLHTGPYDEGDVRARMSAPGQGPSVRKGATFVSQGEALQDVEKTLERMDDAMKKVGAKDGRQNDSDGGEQQDISGFEGFVPKPAGM